MKNRFRIIAHSHIWDNAMLIQYKILAILFIVLADFASGYGMGLYHEHEKFMAYQNEEKGLAEAQAQAAKIADAKNKVDSDEAQQGYVQAIGSVHDWYTQHPNVLVQHVAGTGKLPGTADNPKGVNAATSTSDDDTLYTDEQCEEVAVQMYALQQRLIIGGVTIK